MNILQKIIPLSLLFLCLLSTCKSEEEPIIVEEPQVEEEGPKTEECEALAELGIFTLLDSSKAFIPYRELVNRVIFSDSSGMEYIGEVFIDRFWVTNGFSAEEPCKLDSTVMISYELSREERDLIVKIRDLDLSLRLVVQPRIFKEDYSAKLTADCFYFSLGNISTPSKPKSSFGVMLNPRNYPNPESLNSFTEFESEFIIHNKEFKNVYVKDDKEDDKFKLYYNEEVGIVGIKNIEQSIDLKYERIE